MFMDEHTKILGWTIKDGDYISDPKGRNEKEAEAELQSKNPKKVTLSFSAILALGSVFGIIKIMNSIFK